MKVVLFLVFLILHMAGNTLTWAVTKPSPSEGVFKVLPNSRLQSLIDFAVEDTFKSPMGPELCRIFKKPDVLSYSVGVTLKTADALFKQHCRENINQPLLIPKIFPKEYFLVKPQKKLDKIQSWTTPENKTFILLDQDLDREVFKKIIIHELAISIDSKANMLLTSYYAFTGKYSREMGDEIVIHLPRNLSDKDQALGLAFNASTYPAIMMTFATLRAINFERLVEGVPVKKILMDHVACTRSFHEIFKIFQNNPDLFVDDQNPLYGDLISDFAQKNKPENIHKTLREILNPSLKLREAGNITFCQYMALPLLSPKSLYSMFASGPRPRVGGGWETRKNVSSPDSKAEILRLFEEEKERNQILKVDPNEVGGHIQKLLRDLH